MLRSFLVLVAGVSASWAQASMAPVYQTDFSGASVSAANAPIDGGGEVQSGFTAGPYLAGPGVTRMRLVAQGEDFPPKSDPASWGDRAFISEGVGKNAATTPEEAVAADAYIEFSLQSVEPVDFTRIEFSMVGSGTRQPGGITLRSSADNFSSDLGEVMGPLSNIEHPVSVDLRGRTGFAGRREVAFRFYLYDSFEGHNNRLIGISDVRVWAEPARQPASP